MGATWSVDRLAPYLSQGIGVPADRLAEAFRPATADDLPQILDLRRAVNGDDVWWDDEAFVRWRYFENEGAPPRYWIFEREGEALGGMGLEPVELAIDGRRHEATRTLDIMVRPDLQGRGLGALMNLLLFAHHPITMVSGSNEQSHKLISRMFEQALDFRMWKLLARSRSFVERRVPLRPAARVAAAGVDALLAFERRRHRRPAPQGIEIRDVDRFDDRVTTLSRAHEAPGTIMVRRSAGYLNWRFARNPRVRYRILAALAGDRLVGYVVTRLNLARPNPSREGDVVDWLAAPAVEGDASPLPALLQGAVARLVADGAGVVRCLAFGASVEPLMAAAGLRPRPVERMPFFVRAAVPAVHERLVSGTGWFLTSCDFDVE